MPKRQPMVRAISVRQPFAEGIVAGWKRFEYRTVRTNIRERVWVYASSKPRMDAFALSSWRKAEAEPGELVMGMIIGSVEIVGCRVHPTEGFAYALANPKRVRPWKPKGQPCPIFWKPKGRRA